MNENNENNSHETEAPNVDRIRAKLILATEQLTDKLPEILEAIKKPDMQTKMMMNAFRPFLPKLVDSLMKALIEAPDENILKLVDYEDGLHQWLTTD